ncbi:MAG: hypothetical protein ACLFTG_04165 [Alphaproteobacteria bacterium]
MTQPDDPRRRRQAALMQLAADVLRRCGRRDGRAAAVVRALEGAAAGELVAPRRDRAAAV